MALGIWGPKRIVLPRVSPKRSNIAADVSAGAARWTERRLRIRFSPRLRAIRFSSVSRSCASDGLLEGDLPAFFKQVSVDKVDFNAVKEFKDPLFEQSLRSF